MKTAPLLPFAMLTFLSAPPLCAQGTWDAILNIDPYPSPYYSDWDVDPQIATLSVINRTAAAQQVRIFFNVTNRANRVVLSATSAPQAIGAGATVIFENPYDIEGSTKRDAVEDELAARTGRLREGDYTACAVVADNTGFSLAESCADFTIVYPDAPMLLGPDNTGAIDQPDPLFQWTPVTAPVAFQLTYVLRVVEVLQGQTPADALRSNIPHYQLLDGTLPSLRYPIDARPFEPGKKYAWSVQVLDQNGYAAATNDGRSEIWTFTYDDGSGEGAKIATSFTLFNSVDDDTEPTLTEAEEASKLGELCVGGKPGFLGLNVKSPLGFPAFENSPALLYQDTVAKKWWVLTENQQLQRQVLLHGTCGGPLGGLQWVASKKIGRQQKINDWLSMNAPPFGIQHIDYGVFVLALTSSTVVVPAGFQEGADFLDGHEIEVMRGLNAFAVVNLEEHDFWSVFQSLGYEEKQIELQGFVGFDVSWAVSVTGAVSPGERQHTVDLSQERTFLTLSVAFPERKPIGPLAHVFESMRLGLELEIQDSTGWSIGVKKEDGKRGATGSQSTSFDIVPKLTHTIALRSDRFPNVKSSGDKTSRELVGSFGIDFATERETSSPIKDKAKNTWMSLQRKTGRVAGGMKRIGQWFGADPDAVVCTDVPTKKADFVLTYELDGEIALGQLVIAEPGLEIHFQKSEEGKTVKGDDRGLSFAVAATLRGADWDKGIGAGISVAREKDSTDPPDQKCSPRKRSQSGTEPPPMTRPRANAVSGPPEKQPQTRPRSDADADKPAAEQTRSQPQGEKPAEEKKEEKKDEKPKWTVQWRIATEGMPLMELLRGIVGGIAGVISALSK